MTVDTDIMVMKKDLGKKLYRKKTFYTLVIEQEVLAKDKEEADVLLSDCGIDHSQINHEITETKKVVETYMVDANYTDSGATEYVGQVAYTDDEYAEENGDVEITDHLREDEGEVSPMKDYKDNVLTEGQ
jgi:hypothetical protein